jgi:hypothetical protein
MAGSAASDGTADARMTFLLHACDCFCQAASVHGWRLTPTVGAAALVVRVAWVGGLGSSDGGEDVKLLIALLSGSTGCVECAELAAAVLLSVAQRAGAWEVTAGCLCVWRHSRSACTAAVAAAAAAVPFIWGAAGHGVCIVACCLPRLSANFSSGWVLTAC